jgi:hypothetical protein
MSDDNPETPGHFDSELDDYPGYFELPHPFLDRHMRVWWKHAIEDVKGLGSLDFELYDGEWKGLVALVERHGKWAVEGVPVGDLASDGVPMVVKSWAMQEADNYIYPFLPLRIRLKLSGISATG